MEGHQEGLSVVLVLVQHSWIFSFLKNRSYLNYFIEKKLYFVFRVEWYIKLTTTVTVFFTAVAWENSRHFATQITVSPRNDVWETSAEIPYWWRVTTHVWVVLLIGWSKFSRAARPIRGTTQIQVVTRHQYGISTLVSQTSFRRETSPVV